MREVLNAILSVLLGGLPIRGLLTVWLSGGRIEGVLAFDGLRRCQTPRPNEGMRNQGRILYKARRNKPLVNWQKYFDKTVAVVRAAVERPFALMKGADRFARCCYLGLARNDTHLQLFASACTSRPPWCWFDELRHEVEACPMTGKKDEKP